MAAKPNPLKGIKATSLKWDEPNEEMRMAVAMPEWVKTAVEYLRSKLSELGVDLGAVVSELGDQSLHRLIALVEKAPASFQKMLILAALNYIDRFVHSDELKYATLKGE
jgi:hypothetical protein